MTKVEDNLRQLRISVIRPVILHVELTAGRQKKLRVALEVKT